MATETVERLQTALGRRIAELRSARGLTQEQFAERYGTSVRYFQEIEAGRENLTLDSLVRIARLLKVRVRDLFDEPTRPRAKPGRPPKRRTPSASA
jgi:transcriptional regulator with XRE-family HTH domain